MANEKMAAQQFKGLMSEVLHSVTKLVITRDALRPGKGMLGTLGGVGATIANAFGGAATATRNLLDNLEGGEWFEVQINPETYEKTFGNSFSSPPTQNSSKSQQNFKRTGGQDLTLKFTLDGTGVVPASLSDLGNFARNQLMKTVGMTDVSYVTNQINKLEAIVYDIKEEKHEPAIVLVAWGDVPPFTGRVTSMKVEYKLFHPSGIPLRAQVELQLKEHKEKPVSGQNSPDVTHRRTVTAYDTLPLLSLSVYNDDAYYWQVAQANGLTHFRKLKENTDLYFPPLDRSK